VRSLAEALEERHFVEQERKIRGEAAQVREFAPRRLAAQYTGKMAPA